jgi:ADP-ribosyl-[dinitrogen reductase] hydrolase
MNSIEEAQNLPFRGMLSLRKTENMVQGISLPRVPSDSKLRNRFRGCLLGGAVGDALGAPVEFLHWEEIERIYGKQGIRDYAPAYGKIGAITDDTQMTMFTAEGLLSARMTYAQTGHDPDFFRATSASYLRWLATQENTPRARASESKPSWLLQQRKLYSRRAPGTTCLSALQSLRGKQARAANDSKGCGGVMRSAPVGMYFAHELLREPNRSSVHSRIFGTAKDLASITHGHPTGCLAAGAFALIVALLLTDHSLADAVKTAKDELKQQDSHKETLVALERAEKYAQARPGQQSMLRELGKGYVAEEALAMGLYCALSAEDFACGAVLAVNHSGDSDSTGTITGNLLGAIHGVESIPAKWLTSLELREIIEALADDLAAYPEWRILDRVDASEMEFYSKRYPPL